MTVTSRFAGLLVAVLLATSCSKGPSEPAGSTALTDGGANAEVAGLDSAPVDVSPAEVWDIPADSAPEMTASAEVATQDDALTDLAADGDADSATLPDVSVATDAFAQAEVAGDTTAPGDAVPAADADSASGQPNLVQSGVLPCGPNVALPGQFTDVAADIGVDLVRPKTWPVGTPHEGLTVREGGGFALADFDGDGTIDLFFPVQTGVDRLYLSLGKGPWQYQGFDMGGVQFSETSAVAGDLDNDGDPDLVIGGNGIRVLRNDGAPKFVDVTASTGLTDGGKGMPLLSASLADIDGDGLVDLFLGANKEEKPGKGSWPPPTFNQVLLRATAPLQFSDVSDWLVPGTQGVCYIGSWFDFDGDGDQDLLIVNDFGTIFAPNRMLRNDGVVAGKVKFTDVSSLTSMDLATNGMGAAPADYDRDGDMDIFVTGWQGQNMLLRNKDAGTDFDDVSLEAGTLESGPKFASWGALFFDADNDGWLDLYVTNGNLQGGFGGGGPGGGPGGGGPGGGGPGVGFTFDNPLDQEDRFFRSLGNGKFEDATSAAKLGSPLPDRSVAYADFDRDGALDLVVGSVWGAPKVYRNHCNGAAWLEVRLHGKSDNRDGIGARVSLTVGGVTHIRDIESGSSGLWDSGELIAHFGLGSAAKVDKLKVRWPSGAVQEFVDITTRQYVTVLQP